MVRKGCQDLCSEERGLGAGLAWEGEGRLGLEWDPSPLGLEGDVGLGKLGGGRQVYEQELVELPVRRDRKEQTRIRTRHPTVRATGNRNKPEGKVLVENKEREWWESR